MRRLILILMLATLVTLDVAPMFAMAQDPAQVQQPVRKRRTLFDLLFGPKEPKLPVLQQAPRDMPVKPRRTTPPPPAKPIVAKVPGATRVAVFGDSLADDLGGALDRLYADDPNLVVVQMANDDSGLVRTDYYDWPKAIADQITANSFDVAVVMIGANDRQTLNAGGQAYKSLTDGWTSIYTQRLNAILNALRTAGKPVVWVGLPPMLAPQYSAAIGQISALQRLASFSGGAQFLDIYDRFVDDNGKYTTFGPDLSGQQVRMRKDDGVHFANAGADKLAFYVSQSLKLFYNGGGGIAVVDPLKGTDAAAMVRPPYQGLGQIRLLQVAGAVTSLTNTPARADALVTATRVPGQKPSFSLDELVKAPTGRADAFGAGVSPATAP
ncbi:MAG TPA: SGNH family hydrolase [Arsenicitalea sp.]|jgi:hypothetical protein|nr:SGNH family hydrolase [Arsenicitalea sp.]